MNTSHPYSKKKAKYDKQWRQNHKPERIAYRKAYDPLWRTTAAGRWSIFRARAKQRKLRVGISLEEFLGLAPDPCFYCGRDRSDTWGLDRIDSAGEYTLNNVRPCCRTCNLAKNDMTVEEFRTWATALARHWNL